jgi:hypothetical protein
MVLEIVAKRKSGDLPKLKLLCDTARSESERLARCAQQDVEVYGEYMKSRQPAPELIEVPIQAARSALSGMNLCAEAAGMVRGAVAIDLGTAAILLEGAVRAILLCVDANLQQLPSDEAAAERKMLEEKARRQLDSVLRQVITAGVKS